MPRTPDKDMVESAPLLAEIMAYCQRTETRPAWVGAAAFNHPGYVQLIRKRGHTSKFAAEAIRQVMADHPQGLNEAILRDRLMNARSPMARRLASNSLEAAAKRREEMESRERVHRDACPRCGVRADIGCKHSKGRLGVHFG